MVVPCCLNDNHDDRVCQDPVCSIFTVARTSHRGVGGAPTPSPEWGLYERGRAGWVRLTPTRCVRTGLSVVLAPQLACWAFGCLDPAGPSKVFEGFRVVAARPGVCSPQRGSQGGGSSPQSGGKRPRLGVGGHGPVTTAQRPQANPLILRPTLGTQARAALERTMPRRLTVHPVSGYCSFQCAPACHSRADGKSST